MQTFSALAALRAKLVGWKRDGARIALVPTMGNLHAGHYALLELARRHADRVVVSVFVNPTQFGPNEDFSRYPRTPQADADGLRAADCDALWLPSVETMYPAGVVAAVSVHVPRVTEMLEGAHRPGHFDGVTSVVARLFHQVQPDVAVFGRKDYQQLVVVRAMVDDLAFPITLIAAPTRREPDGLALSSRNRYLSQEERAIAPILHQTLAGLPAQLQAGLTWLEAQAAAEQALHAAGFVPDYVAIRQSDLSEPRALRPEGALVGLVAARLGTSRLIDSFEFTV